MNTDTTLNDPAQPPSPPPEKHEGAAPHHPVAATIAAWARDELAALTGCKVDSIAGIEKTGEGWQLTVVVTELHRIPASTDILATYEVALDESGDIVNYHRGDRYLRGQIGDHL